jgi:hypothetical protein
MADIETLPPPVPAECDLRDFAFMPLDVLRLRDSEMAAVQDAEAFRAAVLLWCASWHQVPASSLPDDQTALARLAGYGRDLKMWQRAREGGALRGWVKHADGRLYHGVVAEKANQAWKAKAAQRQRTEAARRAREEKRQQTMPHPHAEMTTEAVAGHVTQTVALSVTETVTESKGQGQGQGEKKESKPALISTMQPRELPDRSADPLNTGMADMKPDPETGRPTISGWDVEKIFDRCMDAAGLNPATSQETLKIVAGWLREDLDPDDFVAVIRRIASRPGGDRPRSLRFFDRAVREECKPTGYAKRLA